MHSNQYTLIYAAVLSVITAIVLAVAAEGLKPAQEANIALDKKSNILRAVRLAYDERTQIENTYAERVQEMVINAAGEPVSGVKTTDIDLKEEVAKTPENRRLPLYIYTEKEGKKYYIVPLRGTGLWGPIWGYISLQDDFDTVYGAFFDHKGETPGLGAEIAELPFQQQFQGKKIMSNEGQFVSVNVVKKTDKVSFGNEHRVDAISGGTITSRGTDAMLKNCTAPYLAYFEKIKK
ncbi:NADH:ubiquinone reductase (Na(+)-transporting) subunit C [Runella sp. CRIBMP]|uniref:NADH:ubiquinone reductase (Na(+)-transporting) subunit C n=1 Tax=Runella sp. CRIBMP TaxID=2683261 RepID=UPI001412772C|nr:NADH:ubiquinone reductase (Na(+)-transporting) subunit C [Runella sp. CRIBMP]NBB19827.1 NADH:ubiquinone reductase (Na(+)-transporting) subunit C [Runella sp. CRIBMP]